MIYSVSDNSEYKLSGLDKLEFADGVDHTLGRGGLGGGTRGADRGVGLALMALTVGTVGLSPSCFSDLRRVFPFNSPTGLAANAAMSRLVL